METLYKRTKQGGFVFWEGEVQERGGSFEAVFRWGKIDTPGKTIAKVFNSHYQAEHNISNLFNEKKRKGLYHTLNELDIQHADVTSNFYIFMQKGGLLIGTLEDALDATLPPLDSEPAVLTAEAEIPVIETINRNIPIIIHLPRL